MTWPRNVGEWKNLEAQASILCNAKWAGNTVFSGRNRPLAVYSHSAIVPGCSDFLGSNFLGSDFLGSNFLGSDFLGCDFLGSNFLGWLKSHFKRLRRKGLYERKLNLRGLNLRGLNRNWLRCQQGPFGVSSQYALWPASNVATARRAQHAKSLFR
jgi:uncharacterized protein YjbI with pentapeptide repeats